MIISTTVRQKRDVLEYWVLRAIYVSDRGVKTVREEQEFDCYPSPEEIAEFVYSTEADFVSVVHNFRRTNDKGELPFC